MAMRPLYGNKKSPGYATYVAEVRSYAAFIAGMLGYDVRCLDEEQRIRLYHQLVNEHPYAYPLALELSLYLSDAAAESWIVSLVEGHYSAGFGRIVQEVGALLVWRSWPRCALARAVAHAERRDYYLGSVRHYLHEHHPMLARYIDKRKRLDEAKSTNVKEKLALALETRLQSGFSLLRYVLLRLTQKKDFPYFAYRIYLKTDAPGAFAQASLVKKLFTWCMMRFITCKVNRIVPQIAQSQWLDLPTIEEGLPAVKARATKGEHYDIATIIWGQEYVNRFTSCNLPSLMAPGNVPFLAQNNAVRFVFYTTREGMDQIKAIRQYDKILQYATVKFVFIDTVLERIAVNEMATSFSDKYKPMIIAHNHLWNAANKDGSYIIYNFPDIVLQNNMFMVLSDLQSQGKRCVLVYPGPYVSQESFEAAVAERKDDDVLSLDRAELNDLIGRYRHHYAQCFYEGSRKRFFSVTLSLHDAGNEGFLANTTCIAPIMCKPHEQINSMDGTLDWFHPWTPYSKAEEILLFRDTDTVCIASLEPDNGQDDAVRHGQLNKRDFRLGLRKDMALPNRVLFSQPIRFYRTENQTKEVWDEAERKAGQFVRSVQTCGARFSKDLPPLEFFIRDDG